MIRICQSLVAALLLSFAGTVFAVGEEETVNINTADAGTLAQVRATKREIKRAAKA